MYFLVFVWGFDNRLSICPVSWGGDRPNGVSQIAERPGLALALT
ncbi:hypothetical protein [Nodosilinea sp. E11]|nr:hypothetical protein [Nodosilinea sp. E11]WOD38564.1 hypothetical protein RRF56_20350 [Nodosilinea sp. E11]